MFTFSTIAVRLVFSAALCAYGVMPPLRLDVRLHSGPAIGYPLAGEFLVGSAPGCDLRLPDASLPPVVCQISVGDDGIRVRRRANTVISHNGREITESVTLTEGDTLHIGAVEIALAPTQAAILTPKLVPIEAQPDLRQTALDEQARELDEDRKLWYAKRQQIEDEIITLKATVPARQAERDAALQQREWAVEQRETELKLYEAELATARQTIAAEFETKKQELLKLQAEFAHAEPLMAQWRLERDEAVRVKAQLERDRAASVDLQDRLNSLAGREIEVVRRETHLANETATLEAERAAHKEDLLRFDRWKGSLDAREATLEQQAKSIDERYSRLKSDAADLEDQLKLAAAEDERQQAERVRLDKVRIDVDAQGLKFAERAAEVEAQQAMLAVLRAKLDRQAEDLKREREAFEADRDQNQKLRDELDGKLRDADLMRSELGYLHDDHAAKERAVKEQQGLFQTTLEEFRRQREEVLAAEASLKDRERELDERATVTAEQAATLKSKVLQCLELQERLEADRVALREREAAMAEAEAARQALQEQLRKRSEELNTRGRQVDELSKAVSEAKAQLESQRGGVDEWRTSAEIEIAKLRGEIEVKTTTLTEREENLARQVARMKDLGTALTAERQALLEEKQAWNLQQQNRNVAGEQIAELRRQAPEIVERTTQAFEKLNAMKDSVRGQLAELQSFAKTNAEHLAERERVMESARTELRGMTTEFRTQLHDWQQKVGDLRRSLKSEGTKQADRQVEIDAGGERLKTLQAELDRKTRQMEEDARLANEKRNEMERHLADMREWYRRKLAALNSGKSVDDSDMPTWEDDDDSDTKLGEILRSRGILDARTLSALTQETQRQRKTLRQTLLASGVVTLYQLALIEAGNLDGLTLGRFRVIDRVRSTSRESVFRVYDPQRPHVATLLRLLTESEGRDEFREKYQAATAVHHPNLVNVLEVTDLNGKPAALIEAVDGMASGEWPALAATPGVWVKLLSDAAKAVSAVHAAGLNHGRIAPERFLLTSDGTLKLAGLGESGIGLHEPNDLRALGRVAYAWSQIGSKRRVGKGKPFPAELAAIVRRLEAGSESPMGDVVSLDRPFRDADEVVSELERLSAEYPLPHDVWNKLLSGPEELRAAG